MAQELMLFSNEYTIYLTCMKNKELFMQVEYLTASDILSQYASKMA